MAKPDPRVQSKPQPAKTTRDLFTLSPGDLKSVVGGKGISPTFT